MRLNLRRPVYYTPIVNPCPFACGERPIDKKTDKKEKIYCFEINEAQRLRVEPEASGFLGSLIFGGIAACMEGEGERRLDLPRGNYLFAQEKEVLSRDRIIAAAVEIQQEGLWQRLLLKGRFYLRYLYEDGFTVTQLFRPYC